MTLDLSQVEQVPVEALNPPVEEFVKEYQLNVKTQQTPEGPRYILNFITYHKMYSFIIDNTTAEALAALFKPSRIVTATPADLSRIAP